MANSNDQYIFQAKELLRIISNTGQEAYIVLYYISRKIAIPF